MDDGHEEVLMQASIPQPRSLSIDRLRTDLRGDVLAPGDPGYDEARTVFPGNVDRHPAVVVRPIDAEEVSAVVSVARETGLELAVKSGGHSGPGFGVSDGGIVLDLSAMKGLDIDADGRSAWAETGLTAGEYTTAAGAHGLATGFGDTGSVGIGGITLGGGIGFLVRKHGLTIDDLLAAEVVTADGRLLHVDENTHPDLFWAIRGGGGNFGVATRFRFRLHDVPSIVGGILMLPATPEVIASFVAEAEAAPDELSTIANVMTAPPMPFIPDEHHGELAIFALMAYAGDTEAGERAVAPFRSLAEPLADLLRPMSYPELYLPNEEGYHPIAVGHTRFADHIDEEAAATILDHVATSPAMMAVTQIRALGGAMARVPADATAFAHRESRLMVTVAAVYERVDETSQHQAWVDELAGILREEQTDRGAYVNFLGDEGEPGIREAYPGATWDRLRSIKRRYDPENLFRRNQNVPPADE
jgi:FAD/FMN-containing dehydrogenase